MMRRGSRVLMALGLLLAGCQPEPRQWLVSVATDAPVPRFGDHLLLEVMGTAATCSGCLRLVGVDGPNSLPVSFGIAPHDERQTVRVRARLYRAEQAGQNGLPDGTALIDAVARLPPLEGETRVAFNLSMRCFGVASLTNEGMTCDPATGALAPEPVLPLLADAGPQPRAGSWPNAATVPCGTVPEGMVCVPGSAFVLGTPQPEYAVTLESVSQPEHLVQLSAFAMDIEEVTVDTVQRLVLEGRVQSEPIVKNKNAPESLQGACTYLGTSDDAADNLPVNCVSHSLAADVCAALGKRLPTEAEWEYAAGNLADETAYPWGNSGDLCTMALIGVGRNSLEGDAMVFENAGCRPVEMPSTWGPVAGGNPSDTTISLGIRNLAGSMSEWVADIFAPYTAPCWQSSPVCTVPAPGDKSHFSVRGSAWAGYKLEARATARSKSELGLGNPYIGFRCAMSM